MPYEFPTRYLRPQEVLNPDDFTLELRGASNLLSGQLDAHNINEKEDISDRLAYRARLGMRHSWTSGECSTADQGDIGPTEQQGLPTPDSGGYPQGIEGKTCEGSRYAKKSMANSGSWQTVRTVDVPKVAQGTRLWITAFCQYLWWGESHRTGGAGGFWNGRSSWPGHMWAGGDADSSTKPSQHNTSLDDFPIRSYGARVQFGIRVNGRVIDESVTGAQDPEQKSVLPLLLKVQRGGGETQFPGPSQASTPQRSTLNPTAWPCRFGCVVDVTPGDVIVELVFRRADDYRYTKKYGNRRESNYVAVTAAQLLVMDFPHGPGEKTNMLSVSVPSHYDQESLNASSLYDDRLARIEWHLNNLNSRSVGPGALRPEHVQTSCVIKTKSRGLHAIGAHGDYSGFTTNNRRPNVGWVRGDPWKEGNPEKPLVTYAQYNRRGWMLWGVHDTGINTLVRIGAFGSDDTKDRTVVDTGNSKAPTIVTGEVPTTPASDGSGDFIDDTHGYALLQGDWEFKSDRRRTLVVMAEAGVLCVNGDRDLAMPEDYGGSTTGGSERSVEDKMFGASNASCHACFRLGFHVKGQGVHNGWVLPSRTEARVSQTGNFRKHGKNVWRMPTFGSAALMMVLDRPWRDEVASSFYYDWQDAYPGDEFDTYARDYTIDAIGLFVCGSEPWRHEGPTVGLANAKISAFLVDQGPY